MHCPAVERHDVVPGGLGVLPLDHDRVHQQQPDDREDGGGGDDPAPTTTSAPGMRPLAGGPRIGAAERIFGLPRNSHEPTVAERPRRRIGRMFGSVAH
jgi:hypothetical protein